MFNGLPCQNQKSIEMNFIGDWRLGIVRRILFILFSIQGLCEGAIVSRVVGRVGDYFLTSREVIASRFIEKVLFPDDKVNIIDNVSSPEFVVQVTSALLEKVVAVEAESFSVASISDSESKEIVSRVKRQLAGVRTWQKLEISQIELQELVSRKLRSKRFLKYKTEAANLTVTDFEVKDYYEKSRYKFGNLPLESFKENIRQFLIQKQTEDRLREWFEVLRKKYQVRNFLAEAAG